MEKIVVTGCNGFLGQHLVAWLADRGFDVIAYGRGMRKVAVEKYFDVDLTDKKLLTESIASIAPGVIIHNAAMSKPDECESDRPKCLLNNVDATSHLLDAAALHNPYIIYISTDFVFGDNGPHGEEDTKGPLNFYGRSKWMAEEAVGKSGLDHAIVRPVLIYGPATPTSRPTFLDWVRKNILAGTKMNIVADQVRNPTYVSDLCAGIETLLRLKKTGAYHLAGKERLTPYEMAIKTADFLGKGHELIRPVIEADFPEKVKRAKNGGLKIEKAMVELNYRPTDFDVALRASLNG